MDEDRLYHDPDLADFYDLENGWERAPDFAYCQALARDAASVLDLGCGTGELAAALAEGRTVVGVDPAAAMLEIARAKPGGADFVEGDARTLRLGRRFDLVLLTGHAFQVFLTADDRRAVLATIAAHLAEGGRFIFDSRNPACREWEEWGPDASLRIVEHPRFGAARAWNDAAFDPATSIVTYGTHYEIQATGKRLSAASRIAFPDKAELEASICEAGLRVDRWLGDWEGNAWQPGASEFIPLGGLR